MRQYNTDNNYPQWEKSLIGNSRPVWYEIKTVIPGGFTIDLSKYPKGSVLPAGSPIQYNEGTRTAKVYVSAVVFEDSAGAIVKIKKLMKNSQFSVGQFISKRPANIGGTETGYQIIGIDTSNEEYDVLTLSAASGLQANDIVIEVDATGATAKNTVIPNALTHYDIFTDADSKQFTATAVVGGQIYERRIFPVADETKAKLPKITFLNTL